MRKPSAKDRLGLMIGCRNAGRGEQDVRRLEGTEIATNQLVAHVMSMK